MFGAERGLGIAAGSSARELDCNDEHKLDSVVACLLGGGVVAIPTDTLYGLAADAFNAEAIERVFTVKERPEGLALPVLLAGAGQLPQVVPEVPEAARILGEALWPGPLTLVMRPKPGIAEPTHRRTADGCSASAGPLGAARVGAPAGTAHHRYQRQPQRRGGPANTGGTARTGGGPSRLCCNGRASAGGYGIDHRRPDRGIAATVAGGRSSLRKGPDAPEYSLDWNQ